MIKEQKKEEKKQRNGSSAEIRWIYNQYDISCITMTIGVEFDAEFIIDRLGQHFLDASVAKPSYESPAKTRRAQVTVDLWRQPIRRIVWTNLHQSTMRHRNNHTDPTRPEWVEIMSKF